VVFDSNQKVLASMLSATGARVEAFFRNFSNTSSKEEVLLQILSKNGKPKAFLRREFDYLIFPVPNAKEQWQEDRVDKKGRSVDLNTISDFMVSWGFAFLCKILHPLHQAGSRFCYLGREDGSGFIVIALAQRPEAKDFLYGFYDKEFGNMAYLVQGFVWLHPGTYQIVRVETGVISPAEPLQVQTTKVDYQEFRFKEAKQSFWLPSEVTVNMTSRGVMYRNLHRYSDYHLFEVRSDYKLNLPKDGKARP
jgi:hypothetical protein